jgi:hypothetical protein
MQQTNTNTHNTSLRHSDADMARVLEDLIELLISRGTIQFKDLPQAAQDKLLQRQQARLEMSQQLKLIADDDSNSGFI